MSTAHAGKDGRFTHGAVNYPAVNWSCDIEDALQDYTNMNSGGWREFVSNIKGLRFTVETVFDPSLTQITAGATLTNAVFRVGTAYALTMASGLVQRVRPSQTIEGKGMQTIEGVSNGTVNTTFA